MHGGTAARGIASPNFKHGRWSKYLPAAGAKDDGLADKFQDAMNDGALLQLRQDAALADAMLTAYTARLKPGRALSKTQREAITDLLDTRRKIVDSETKRQRELGAVVPAAQFLMVMNFVAQTFREFVLDPKDLGEIQNRIERLLASVRMEVQLDGD